MHNAAANLQKSPLVTVKTPPFKLFIDGNTISMEKSIAAGEIIAANQRHRSQHPWRTRPSLGGRGQFVWLELKHLLLNMAADG